MATVNRQVVCLITSAIAIVFIIFIITIIAGKSEEEEVGRKSRYSASPKSKVIEQRLELSKYHDNNDFYVYPSGDKYFFKRFQASEAMQRFMFDFNKTDPNVFRDCTINKAPPENEVCGVNVNKFKPCDWEHGYGIKWPNYTAPCIFMKLNSDITFNPTYITDNKFPSNMPEDLKYDIKTYIRNNATSANLLWVSCEGVSEQDRKNVGPISYIPQRGFIEYYFPCQSEELCIPPVIALQFIKPKRNVAIKVKCTTWGENYNESIDLLLYVDDNEEQKKN